MIDDSIKVENLVAFFQDEGHNLMAFGDLDARKHHRSLALHFGIDYEPFVSFQLHNLFSTMNWLTPKRCILTAATLYL